ncbi:MAG: SRPBCC domain-containing protein [Acidimicrobiales bacterium]|nr:SRPBCC domain-containing protein [Acidimicrobiales bacterium]
MDSIERHVTLDADLDEAWELLTRPEDLAGWLGADVAFDPTPGSAGLVVDHDGTRRHLTVDRVEQGRSISWRWWTDGDEQAASRVEITLVPTSGGTRVHVVEAPLPAAPSGGAVRARASAGTAWSHRLLHLEALLLLAASVRG